MLYHWVKFSLFYTSTWLWPNSQFAKFVVFEETLKFACMTARAEPKIFRGGDFQFFFWYFFFNFLENWRKFSVSGKICPPIPLAMRLMTTNILWINLWRIIKTVSDLNFCIKFRISAMSHVRFISWLYNLLIKLSSESLHFWHQN